MAKDGGRGWVRSRVGWSGLRGRSAVGDCARGRVGHGAAFEQSGGERGAGVEGLGIGAHGVLAGQLVQRPAGVGREIQRTVDTVRPVKPTVRDRPVSKGVRAPR